MDKIIQDWHQSLIWTVIETSSCDWEFETDWEIGFEEWDEEHPFSAIACTRFQILPRRMAQAIFSVNWQWMMCQGEDAQILLIETAIHEVCHLAANLQMMDAGLPPSKIHRGAGHGRIWKEHVASFGLKGGKRHLGVDWIDQELPDNTLEIIKKACDIFGGL